MMKDGVATITVIVVELLTLPGVVVPATPIEYGPGVVDEVVVIVSVDVAIDPEFKVGDAGLSVTIGRVGFGRLVETVPARATVEVGSPFSDSRLMVTVSDVPWRIVSNSLLAEMPTSGAGT
jgi:hypothetical protein